MRKLNVKFIKSYNALIAGLLAILGYASSCESAVEYGTPAATFKVSGKITSAKTSEGIENIRAVMQYDTTYTDKNGTYNLEAISSPASDTFSLFIKDIDGSANGAYQDLDTLVDFKDAEFINGDDDWYEGETSKKVNLKLKPKK